MIKNLNLLVLKSHWTLTSRPIKGIQIQLAPHRHLFLPFPSPFLTILKGWKYCTFQCIPLLKWKGNYPHPQLKNLNPASAMILPRRNLKQLLQQKVAHMERNVHWKKWPILIKKCEPFYTEKLYTVLIPEKWLVKNKQLSPQTHSFFLAVRTWFHSHLVVFWKSSS